MKQNKKQMTKKQIKIQTIVNAFEHVFNILITCILIAGFFYATILSVIALNSNPCSITFFSSLSCIVGLISASHQFCKLEYKKV